MTFAISRKPYNCWGCEYFVHESPTQSYAGYCRRSAPKALDLYGLESGLFNNEYYHANQLATGGVYPQTILSFLLPSTTVKGRYAIMASYLWSMSGLTDMFWGRVVTDANPTVDMAMIEDGITTSTSQFRVASSQSIQDLPAGEQNINVEIGVQPLGTTDNAVIKKVRVSLILIQKT